MARKHKRYERECVPACSFSDEVLGVERAVEAHALFEAHPSWTAFSIKSKDAGFTFSPGSYYRHKKAHLTEVVDDDAMLSDEDVANKSHLDIIEMIIRQGAKTLPTLKVGSRDLMSAMQLYYQLTKGSAFQDLEDALALGSEDGPEDVEDLEEPSA